MPNEPLKISLPTKGMHTDNLKKFFEQHNNVQKITKLAISGLKKKIIHAGQLPPTTVGLFIKKQFDLTSGEQKVYKVFSRWLGIRCLGTFMSLKDARDLIKNLPNLYTKYVTSPDAFGVTTNVKAKKQKDVHDKKAIQAQRNLDKLPKGPYGKIFAGDERNVPKNHPERNTSKEEDLITAISNHISSNDKMDPPDTKKIVDVLKSGLYKDIIVPPNVKTVYRGMSVDVEVLEKLTRKSATQLPMIGTIKFKKPIVFKPQGGASSSWTFDKAVAKRFSSEDQISVTLVAETQDNPNMFFDLRVWYSYMDRSFKNEKETMGLGDIRIKEITWNLN